MPDVPGHIPVQTCASGARTLKFEHADKGVYDLTTSSYRKISRGKKPAYDVTTR